MPPNEYYTELLSTLFTYFVVTIFFLVSAFCFAVCYVFHHANIVLLFSLWSLALTPFYYKSNKRKECIFDKLIETERKRQRSANSVSRKQRESNWLKTLNMTHRLVAVRLLSLDVDDIHDLDKHFLQQVALLPGDAPKHVNNRLTICKKHLSRIEAGTPRRGRDSPLLLWFSAFVSSTMRFLLVRGCVAVAVHFGWVDVTPEIGFVAPLLRLIHGF